VVLEFLTSLTNYKLKIPMPIGILDLWVNSKALFVNRLSISLHYNLTKEGFRSCIGVSGVVAVLPLFLFPGAFAVSCTFSLSPLFSLFELVQSSK
jgi:hypothetical protein